MTDSLRRRAHAGNGSLVPGYGHPVGTPHQVQGPAGTTPIVLPVVGGRALRGFAQTTCLLVFTSESSIAASRDEKRRGQSIVEFALILPILLLILLFGIDFGRVFLGWINLNNVAKVAANYAAYHAADDPFDAAAYALAAGDAGLGEANVQGQFGEGTLAIADPQCYDPLVASPQPSLDCHTASDYAPGIGLHVRVSATLPFTFMTPLISSIVGVMDLGATAAAPVLNPPAAPPEPTPPPEPGILVVRKVLTGDLTDFAGGAFEFGVNCNGTEYGPVTITAASGTHDSSPIVGIPADTICTVTETDKPQPGPHGQWDDPSVNRGNHHPRADTVFASITNVRTYNASGPSPTATPTLPPCTNPNVTITPSSTSAKLQRITVNFTGDVEPAGNDVDLGLRRRSDGPGFAHRVT